ISIPLKCDGQTFGAFTFHAATPDQLNQDTVGLLQQWSDLLVHAVIAHREAALRAVANAAFSRNDSLRNILRECVEGIVQYLGAAFVRIWILNKSENVLELQASAGLYTRLDGTHSRIPVGKLKIGWIAQEKMPHLTNDLMHDPLINREWAEQQGLAAFAGYPLLVDERVIGVIGMFCKMAVYESTLKILASIADPIAQSIERKAAEIELNRSDAYLREAQKLSRTGSFGWNISSGELYWSEETYRIVGVD